jgi:penicillin-binding protein 1C
MKKITGKVFVILSFAILLLALVATTVWIVGPYFCQDPMIELNKQTPVVIWKDTENRVIWNQRTYDAQWRFPVKLKDISPYVIKVMLATEDANFYSHSGVDYFAIARAIKQNIFFQRRISGASTITMQLANFTLSGKRSWSKKIIQAFRARKLEQLYSKERILEEYLNRIPFGGKIHGIEAASLYYFGLKAKELNMTEATLLCGLPQKPNYYRPDLHLSRARKRQKIVLHLLVRRNTLTQAEADYIFEKEPLRFRDFSVKASFWLHAKRKEFFHAIKRVKNTTLLTIDIEKQNHIQSILKNNLIALKGVKDSAVLVIDNKRNQVVAYIGSLDISNKISGEVDVISSYRSAGSALKPFIYGEAILAGLISIDTILRDEPVRYGTYRPENYDGSYSRNVTATVALAKSLNIPVISLVNSLTYERIFNLFKELKLIPIAASFEKKSGLSIALGVDGVKLWDLVHAYKMLANGGVHQEAVIGKVNQNPNSKKHFFSYECANAISYMLRSIPLGQGNYDIAWKTGTSNNNCDAWCIGYTPDFTVGVWCGNKDGSRNVNLIGAKAAAPVVEEIFDYLYSDNKVTPWPNIYKVLQEKELCKVSGLTIGPFCKTKISSLVLPQIPLKNCNQCNQVKKEKLKIISPAPQNYYLPSNKKNITLSLTIQKGTNILWFLNNDYIGKDLTDYQFEVNKRYLLRAVQIKDNNTLSDEVAFSVLTKE